MPNKICFELPDVIVTPDPRTNLRTVGWPHIHVAEEARRVPSNAGQAAPRPVFLPGTYTDFVTLTYRIDPTYDFYVDWTTCQLWRVLGAAPNRQIVLIDPYSGSGTVPSQVFISWFDGGAEKQFQSDISFWATYAGNGRRPHKLPLPTKMNAGNSYTIKVRNLSGLDLAISLQLHGRILRIQQSRDGQPIDPDTAYTQQVIERSMREGAYDLQPITGDRDANRRGAGDAHVVGINPPFGYFDLTTPGSYDVPFMAEPLRVRVDAKSHFFVKSILGHQRAIPSTGGFIEGMTAPVFCQIYDETNRYWLSQAPIPMAALCGDGRWPGDLPVDWAWIRGSDITVQLQSFSLNGFRAGITFEGYFRDIGPC